jgi:methionyl-tRNA formyltransferase
MRVVFVGAVKFSACTLQELIAMQVNIVGVCTVSQSVNNSDHVDLSRISDLAGIPVRLTPNINCSTVLAWIRSLNPDVIFCFGWSQIIRKPLLEIPPMGIIGFHPAALPSNRGRHPLIWALVLDLAETASTFFFMDEGADSGDILSQEPVIIHKTDDAKTLYERITQVAILQIRDFLPRLTEKRYNRYPQDHRKANVWRKRGISDGIIDWRMSAESIHNLVRGLTHPYVGAHFVHRDNIFKVWRTHVESDAPSNIEPGKVLSITNEGLLVKTGIGAIRLCDTTPNFSLVSVGDYL